MTGAVISETRWWNTNQKGDRSNQDYMDRERRGNKREERGEWETERGKENRRESEKERDKRTIWSQSLLLNWHFHSLRANGRLLCTTFPSWTVNDEHYCTSTATTQARKTRKSEEKTAGWHGGNALDNLLIFPETESFNSTVSGDGVKSCPVVWGSLWSYMGVLVVLLFWVS